MIAYQSIQRKRDGGVLTPEEVTELFTSYAEGRLPDYQMSAFLMAVYFQGLAPTELATLVDVMVRSGEVLDLSDLPGIKVDKHSTGGVGDKVSLVLAPLVAALGVPVPMMCGRGLGHTGGTVDKLEAIPGFRTDLSLTEFRSLLERNGAVLMSQTEEIAPLDRRLYALRDVTATVESIPLIASSIMSKKVAEGVDALVLDIKVGGGAFIPELDRGLELARTMIGIGEAYGREVVALVTAMDRPLGYAVGNALEVEEAVFTLQGEGPADLREVTLALAAEMLVLGGVARDRAEARVAAAAALGDGRALEKMRAIIEAQGGNPAVLDDPAILPHAPVWHVVEAGRSGYITRIDTRRVGEIAVELGAGRAVLGAAIDHAVGLQITVKPGDEVVAGDALATVYARTKGAALRAAAALSDAIAIEAEPGPVFPLIGRRVTSAGVEVYHHPG